MITFNEAKQLLDQGIFPCLKYNEEDLDYIIGYNEKSLKCYTMQNAILHATSTNGELKTKEEGEYDE